VSDLASAMSDLRTVGLHPNFWYPMARAPELKRGRTLAAAFGGAPIVLVRTASGRIFALEDRCAHREVPLSMGVVAGEHLRCCYHAWSYDAEGRCVGVPYLREGMEAPPGVRSYPCREAYGLVFVFPGDPEEACRVPLPEISPWASPEYKTMYFSSEVRCHYSFMHENLMDMHHQFLHRRLMGAVRATTLDVRRGSDRLEVDYRLDHVSGRRHPGIGFLVGRRGRGGQAFNVMTVSTRYPYQTLQVRRAGSGTPAFVLWAVYVPVDREQRVNRSFGLLMVRKPPVPGLIYLMWPLIRHFTEAVFAEDRQAVEAEQRAWELQGGDRNREISPVIRGLKDLLRRNGVAAGGTSGGDRRQSSPGAPAEVRP
jgi:phenylpropionate dioxygenase-like ring-hydroxylating dioxygenase large terminal subunit